MCVGVWGYGSVGGRSVCVSGCVGVRSMCQDVGMWGCMCVRGWGGVCVSGCVCGVCAGVEMRGCGCMCVGVWSVGVWGVCVSGCRAYVCWGVGVYCAKVCGVWV